MQVLSGLKNYRADEELIMLPKKIALKNRRFVPNQKALKLGSSLKQIVLPLPVEVTISPEEFLIYP